MNTISDIKFIKFEPDENVINETKLNYSSDFVHDKVTTNLDNIMDNNVILSENDILPYQYIGNSGIINLTINKNVNIIKQFAFSNCDNLKCVIFNTDNIVSLEKGIFFNCDNITTVKLNNVKHISESCFSNCINLNSINLDVSTLLSIDTDAFCSCMSLQNITLGNNVKTIGVGAFNYCTNLNNVKLNNGLETIDIWAFNNCNITDITIPKSVKFINDYAFANNENLHNVIIEGNPIISENAFENCKNIKITRQNT